MRLRSTSIRSLYIPQIPIGKGFIPNSTQVIIDQFDSISVSSSLFPRQKLPNRRVLKQFGSCDLGEMLAVNPAPVSTPRAEESWSEMSQLGTECPTFNRAVLWTSPLCATNRDSAVLRPLRNALLQIGYVRRERASGSQCSRATKR